MMEAVSRNEYDLSDYEEEMGADDPHLLRVELQEFGYWVITTAWDLQAEFGPFHQETGEPEAEWKVRTAAELRDRLPLSQALFEATVACTMVAPNPETMRALKAFERPECFSEGSDDDDEE